MAILNMLELLFVQERFQKFKFCFEKYVFLIDIAKLLSTKAITIHISISNCHLVLSNFGQVSEYKEISHYYFYKSKN
jgi:hypothetical protein